MEERNIVAIDFGSSKIGLAVGRVEGRNLEVTCYKSVQSDGISRGAVSNPGKLKECVQELIEAVENEIGKKINGAVANYPKFPVVMYEETCEINRNGRECIQEEELNNLKQMVASQVSSHTKDVVFDTIAQSYSDDDEMMIPENDMIGRTSEHVEGTFKLFAGKSKDIDNLRQSNAPIETMFFGPLATGKAVLTEDEINTGVALIDMGAEATSVSIWKDGVLRYSDSIPFGGKNITLDIKTMCHISESLAENIKKAYGICMPDKLYNLSEKILQIYGNKSEGNIEIHMKTLSKIVTARVKEILDACLYLVEQSGYADDLNAGIVLTGGSAQLANIRNLARDMSGLNVRIGSAQPVFTRSGFSDEIMETQAAGALGMLLLAKEMKYKECLGDFNVLDELFDNQSENPSESKAQADDARATVEKIQDIWDETTAEEEKSDEDKKDSGDSGSTERKGNDSDNEQKGNKPEHGNERKKNKPENVKPSIGKRIGNFFGTIWEGITEEEQI